MVVVFGRERERLFLGEVVYFLKEVECLEGMVEFNKKWVIEEGVFVGNRSGDVERLSLEMVFGEV